MKKIYKIQIGEKIMWIGPALQLVSSRDLAVPCTEEEHLWVMDHCPAGTIAYDDTEAMKVSKLQKLFSNIDKFNKERI